MKYKDLLTLQPYFSVKQHIPGRLRLKFSLKILDQPEAKALIEEQNEIPQEIVHVRVNKFARSLILEYLPSQLPFELLEQLLNARNEEDGEAALKLLENHLAQTGGDKNANT